MSVDPAQWNGFDWILAAIVGFSAVRAFIRGLVRAIFGLLGIFAGFQVADWNYVAFGEQIYRRQWITSIATSRAVAFLTIAALIMLAFGVAGYAVRKTAHAIGMGPLDRLLGAAFGVGRGVLIGIAVIMGVTAFAPQSNWLQGSQLSKHFLAASHAVSFVIPKDLQ